MSKILIIAEKPSVASKISQALQTGNKIKKEGYVEDDKYIVSHCFGHLFEQVKPKEMDEKYAVWKLENLPFKFDEVKKTVKKDCEKQVKVLETLFKRKDIEEIVDACDADREGEAIYREVYEYTNCRTSASRMWIESMADNQVIRETFFHRKKQNLYNNLYDSAKGRGFSDYHVCLNATMAQSAKQGKTLPLGRVQTPTLNMIVELEKEIKNFTSKPFWTINADTDKKFNAKYFDEDLPNNQFFDKKEAEKVIATTGIGKAKVTKSTITKRKEKTPKLFNLSDLQVEMNRKYKFSAQTVLDSCQRLYEDYGLTTYPRTDENHISEELAENLDNIIRALPNMFENQVDTILENDYKINQSCIAKKGIGAHEALTPTTKKADSVISKLNDVDLKVYKAIVERFLINFYPDAIFNVQEIEFERNDSKFKAKFESVDDNGFYDGLIEKKNLNNQNFVDVKTGDYLNITKLNLEEGKTNPPSRFNEGTLIKTMTNPSKYVKDAHDKEVLKETKGIGTEATRAGIIESLKKNNYITIEKGTIYPTEISMNLMDEVPEILKSIPLTVQMEDSLYAISVGKKPLAEYKEEVYKLCDKIVEEIKNSKIVDIKEVNKKMADKEVICECPHCKGNIVENKFGYGCSDWKNCKVQIGYEAYKRFGVKKVSKAVAKQLLTNGKTTKTQKCYSSAKQKEYDAYLTYEFKEGEQYPNVTGITFD